MPLFDTIKSLTIFFAPILIPRAISFVRSVRQSIARQQHVPRQPLDFQSSRALNILFISTALFLALSLPSNPHAPATNIFALTSSRFSTSTDLLFARLSRLRPLSGAETLLRTQFTSPQARKRYLRFGAETLLSCPFCKTDSPNSYLIHYVPFNILLPHLVHLLILGVATSAPLVGKTAARWRNKFFWLGFFLLVADLCVVSFYNPYEKGVLNTSLIPWSLHTRLYTLRMLMLTTCDALCAGLIYLSATNRFIFGPTPSLPADEQVDQFANMAASDITNATNKIHALGLVRNAITHDPVLRKREDVACRELARDTGWMVGEDGRTILDDDGVSQAISSALAKRAQEKGDHGSSEVDVTKLVMAEVTKFVEGVTASLELQR